MLWDSTAVLAFAECCRASLPLSMVSAKTVECCRVHHELETILYPSQHSVHIYKSSKWLIKVCKNRLKKKKRERESEIKRGKKKKKTAPILNGFQSHSFSYCPSKCSQTPASTDPVHGKGPVTRGTHLML